MPESTTAIVGADSDVAWVFQSTGALITHGHFWSFEYGSCTELSSTLSFGTIAETNDVLARKAIWAPLSIACRPSIARNVPRICEPPIAVEPCRALSRLFRRPAPSLAAVPV